MIFFDGKKISGGRGSGTSTRDLTTIWEKFYFKCPDPFEQFEKQIEEAEREMATMQVFNLKKVWFDKIKAGKKTHEYRDVKPYFMSRIKGFEIGQTILFRCGYKANPEKDLLAKVINLSVVDGRTTDLKHNNLVYDIEFELIGECGNVDN